MEIDLLVRGICALRPGIRGVSDRIRVRSIVGRFLEHSRIYYFSNGGEEEVYLGSADWMPRNLYERVEVIFPVKEALLRERIRHEMLAAYLADNLKSRLLQKDGPTCAPGNCRASASRLLGERIQCPGISHLPGRRQGCPRRPFPCRRQGGAGLAAGKER